MSAAEFDDSAAQDFEHDLRLAIDEAFRKMPDPYTVKAIVGVVLPRVVAKTLYKYARPGDLGALLRWARDTFSQNLEYELEAIIDANVEGQS